MKCSGCSDEIITIVPLSACGTKVGAAPPDRRRCQPAATLARSHPRQAEEKLWARLFWQGHGWELAGGMRRDRDLRRLCPAAPESVFLGIWC